MMLAGNKAKPPPLVKHTTKTIHQVILFLKKDRPFFFLQKIPELYENADQPTHLTFLG